jgi:hypothetical protein
MNSKPKKKKVNMSGFALLAASVISIVIMSIFVRIQNKTTYKYFEKHGCFTIGTVIEYYARTIGPGSNSPASIKFFFKINGIDYYSQSDYDIPDTNGPEEGEKFLCVYLPNYTDKCILLMKYPIKDSIDYKHYIEGFRRHPLRLVK